MKITRETKQKITKLFKSGKSVDQIMLAVADDYPRITATRINEVVRKHLFEQADELWSQAVKIGGKCEISGKNYNLEAHHLIKRDNLQYRWDLRNGICLNSQFHLIAHTEDLTFLELLRTNKPIQYKWFTNAIITFTIETNEHLLQICKDLKEFISKGKYGNSNNKEIGTRQRIVTEADTV